jgi:CheY-like chemotaxis protein
VALELALGYQGYVVQSESSLAEALRADLSTVDVIVSDLRLADGDGWTLLRRLRVKSSIPAIALSGYGGDDELQASRAAGFAAHLTKPVDLQTLMATIERVLHRRKRRRADTTGDEPGR